jgi:hypothetical protein
MAEHVFLNRCGQPITRFGIHTLVERYVQKLSLRIPSLKNKRISPHTIRHTTATHLLRAGGDINTIRAWLGHVSLNTTNVYAEVDMEMKAKALATCEIKSDKRPTYWRKDAGLLRFRKTLQPDYVAFRHTPEVRIWLPGFERHIIRSGTEDLKVGKFGYADAGQMHLYLNYAREHWMKEGENPPVGLILCTEKGLRRHTTPSTISPIKCLPRSTAPYYRMKNLSPKSWNVPKSSCETVVPD